MSDIAQLILNTDHSIPIGPVSGPVTVKNVAGGTVYYKSTPDVSASANDGSLTTGQSATFTVQAWFRADAPTSINAQSDPVAQVSAGVDVSPTATEALETAQTSTNAVLANFLVASDANAAFTILGSGKHQWGAGGASALDSTLYRAASGRLKTDGGLGQYGVTPPTSQPAALTKPAATAATNTSPYGYAQAQADAIVTAVNAIIDVLKNAGLTA